MTAKTYLLRAILLSLILALMVLGLNFAVDPYGITGVRRIPYLNKYKVEINKHTRLLKKYQPSFADYNALIVGNSRVELGINPAHACFRRNGMHVYNLGIPGADVRTQLAYALNVVYQQPIQTVFLSVDFTDFISPELQGHRSFGPFLEQSGGEFKYTASGEPNPDYFRTYFLDYYKSLFSLDALVASIRTIALQRESSPDRDDDGFNPARDFEEAARIEGPRALFDQKMFDLQEKYSSVWYLRDAMGELGRAVEDLDAFLDVATDRGITVYLFTNPFHEKFWDLIRTQGHMPAYEDWMRSMETLVGQRTRGAFIFWDFAKDSAYIHEEIPAEGVKSGSLQWFWEPAHYRAQMGSLMINAILSEDCDTEVAFGHRVF